MYGCWGPRNCFIETLLGRGGAGATPSDAQSLSYAKGALLVGFKGSYMESYQVLFRLFIEFSGLRQLLWTSSKSCPWPRQTPSQHHLHTNTHAH